MNRRAFLVNSGLVLAGAVAMKIPLYGASAQLVREAADDWSIDIVTGNPKMAIARVQRILGAFVGSAQAITYREFAMSGAAMGDIVYVRNGRVVDYRSGADKIAQELADTARALGLPSQIAQPTALRFSSQTHARTPQQVQIFVNDKLVQQAPLARNNSGITIEASTGRATLAVRDRRVAIVDATCKHKTCMRMGGISRAGESLVCIPNRIRVNLDGSHSWGVDGITR